MCSAPSVPDRSTSTGPVSGSNRPTTSRSPCRGISSSVTAPYRFTSNRGRAATVPPVPPAAAGAVTAAVPWLPSAAGADVGLACVGPTSAVLGAVSCGALEVLLMAPEGPAGISDPLRSLGEPPDERALFASAADPTVAAGRLSAIGVIAAPQSSQYSTPGGLAF